MKLRPVRDKTPEFQPPFPMKLYLVGMAPDGSEAIRYDLGCQFTDFGQTVHIPDPTLEILP